MANTKISNLTVGGSLTGTELVPIVQSGSTVRTTTQAIANLAGGATTGTYTNMLAVSSPTTGQQFIVTNLGIGPSLWMYNGTNWRPEGGKILLRSLPLSVTGVVNSLEQIMDQFTLPMNLLTKNGDRLAFKFAYEKNGTADTLQIRIRIGTAGTTSDTILFSSSALTGANKSVGSLKDFRRVNATTLQHLGAVGNTTPSTGLSAFSGVQASQQAFSVTVSDLDTNSLFVSTTLQMSAGLETPVLQHLDVVLECV